MSAVPSEDSRDGDTGRKSIAAVVIAASLIIVGIAERDLSRRPDRKIRGSKTIWRLASFNAIGAVAYLVFGRSR